MGGDINNVGIIICSRINSKRLPNKAFIEIAGKPAHHILLDNLSNLPYPIIMAVPTEQKAAYNRLKKPYPNLLFHYGQDDNPMARMYIAANYYNINYIVRITIDDILIHADTLQAHIDWHIKNKLDYSYNCKIIEGAGCEIIKHSALQDAYLKNKAHPIEHISFYLRNSNYNIAEFNPPAHLCRPYRLTMDYPCDRDLLDIIFRKLNGEITLEKIIRLIDFNKSLLNINRQPEMTVYSCVYNAERYLHNCIRSVTSQKTTFPIEYLLCDDHSTDESLIIMSEYIDGNKIRLISNSENIGLAKSSNRCLEEARGKYILRLDADDFLTTNNSLQVLYDYMESNKDIGVCYPAFYDGSMEVIAFGNQSHHPACALFRTKMLNQIKFKNHLRHLDGYDLYLRMKNQFQIGYMDKPIFFYTKRINSLSHSNLEEREEIRKAIDLQNLV